MPRLHVGKHWPLATRRDVNLDQGTNQYGAAAKYHLFMPGTAGVLGGHLEHNEIEIEEHNVVTDQIANWASPNTLVAGRHLVCTMVATDGGPTGYMVFEWELRDSTAGLLVFGSVTRTTPNVYGELSGNVPLTNFLQPAILDAAGARVTANFIFVGW